MKVAILVISAAVFLAACATPPRVENMIPALDSSGLVQSGKTLRVAEVSGGEKTNPLGSPKIENEGFREALVKTLAASGMFERVSPAGPSDYVLNAEIISQETIGVYQITQTLFVNYNLVDGDTGLEIWKENLYSPYDADLGDAFYGQTRRKMAQEGAIRDNLTRLTEKLSRILEEQR